MASFAGGWSLLVWLAWVVAGVLENKITGYFGLLSIVLAIFLVVPSTAFVFYMGHKLWLRSGGPTAGIAFLVILSISLGWFAYAWSAEYGTGQVGQKLASLGDSFGAINTLFTGLAFWGVVLTLRQQQVAGADQERHHSENLKAQKSISDVNAIIALLSNETTRISGIRDARMANLRIIAGILKFQLDQNKNHLVLPDAWNALEMWSDSATADRLRSISNELHDVRFPGTQKPPMTKEQRTRLVTRSLALSATLREEIEKDLKQAKGESAKLSAILRNRTDVRSVETMR